MIDSTEVKNFWDNRAGKSEEIKTLAVTNLEPDAKLQELKLQQERMKIDSMLELNSNDILLDLGCGVGAWSIYFASRVKMITGVEYSAKMMDIAIADTAKTKADNINFVCSNAIDFIDDKIYSIIFISGLILYLNDAELDKMLKNMSKMTRSGSILFLREPCGCQGRYQISNRWSEALQANYSALYRSRSELVDKVEQEGFHLVMDDDMFPNASPLNKWTETRLRVYLFKKIE